tara:strand:- start:151 stop:363 length:213 start_codon:yes stop_codon:yes gene_type:complete
MTRIVDKEKNKFVKNTCRRMMKWGCEIIEVYVSLYTGEVIITFKHENKIFDIMGCDVKETLEETLQVSST